MYNEFLIVFLQHHFTKSLITTKYSLGSSKVFCELWYFCRLKNEYKKLITQKNCYFYFTRMNIQKIMQTLEENWGRYDEPVCFVHSKGKQGYVSLQNATPLGGIVIKYPFLQSNHIPYARKIIYTYFWMDGIIICGVNW